MYIVSVPGQRNRHYVVDIHNNKLFYGTMVQCETFIKYVRGEENGKIKVKGGELEKLTSGYMVQNREL